jgi:hypothetical protein
MDTTGLMKTEEAQKRINKYRHEQHRKIIARTARDFNWLLCTDEELQEVNSIIGKHNEEKKNEQQN